MKKSMNVRVIAVSILLGFVALLTIPVLHNPTTYLISIKDYWATLVTSGNTADVTYLSKQSIEFQGLVSQARTGADRFYIPSFDWTETSVTEHAYPKVPDENPSFDVTRLFPVGPQVQPQQTEKYQLYFERWIRMLITLMLWIGTTALFSNVRGSFRVLLGVLLTGWGHALLSAILKKPLNEIYYYTVPLLSLGTVIVLYKEIYIRKLKQIKVKEMGWIFALIVSPVVWQAFFLGDLFGPDARSMWFYRYKFEFLSGFVPELFLQNMRSWAQLDYPWYLGGALALSSWLDTQSYAGWYENAAYGSMVWIIFALVACWWRFLKEVPFLYKIIGFCFSFVAFAHLIATGYMDFLWICSFGLFLVDFLAKDKKKQMFTSQERWILLFAAVSFKFEALVIFGVYSVLYFLKNKKFKEILFYLTAAVPVLVQKIYLGFYGIEDQYHLLDQMLNRPLYDAIKRFEAAHWYLIKELFANNYSYLTPLLVLIVYSAYKGKYLRCAKTLGMIYVLCLPFMVIYAYTPNDMIWQISTSAFRIYMVLPIFGVLFLAKYYREDQWSR